MKDSKKTVYLFITTGTGHMNPSTSIIGEYNKVYPDSARFIFYSDREFKTLVEKSGAEFRQLEQFHGNPFAKEDLTKARNVMWRLYYMTISYASIILNQVLRDVEKDRPDLIIFDHPNLHPFYLQQILEKRYKSKKSDLKPPKFLEFSTTFAFDENIYPPKEKIVDLFRRDSTIWTPLYMIAMTIKQIWLSFKFGMNIYNPLKLIFVPHYDIPKVVTVAPALQPFSDKYNKAYRFVGCCINENVRSVQVSDENLKRVLDSFPVINPLESVSARPQTKHKLILVSLGTVFNQNDFITENIISALKMFKARCESQIDITVLVSIGSDSSKRFQDRIKAGSYSVPDNFYILPSVPQIEVLKRASLFITHCGMNSSSESVHFGVPIIGVPVSTDQPLCAERLADDLKLGIKFPDPFNIVPVEMCNAIEKVIFDDEYLQRAIDMSKKSRLFNGVKNGAAEIHSLLHN